MKDIIHFSHANGFPASTYRTIFAELADDYEIRSIERYGHDPRFPVTRDWPNLVDQLLDDMNSQRKVWLVGHSLGGYLSMLAACKRPQWVKGVVMIDSPVIAGWKSGLLRVSQWTGLDERLSPAAATKNRRTHWASRDEAWRHFHSKPAFARWDERMLSDYIDFAIPQTQLSHVAGHARRAAGARRAGAGRFPRGHTLARSETCGTGNDAANRRGKLRVDGRQPPFPDGTPDRNRARHTAAAQRAVEAEIRGRIHRPTLK